MCFLFKCGKKDTDSHSRPKSAVAHPSSAPAVQLAPRAAAKAVSVPPRPVSKIPSKPKNTAGSSSRNAVLSAPKTEDGPSTPPVPIAEASLSDDPWTRAFELFQKKEPELAEDYRLHLATLQGSPADSVDLSAPRSVECLVEQLLQKREEKQWKVSILGKGVKIREQSEKLVKLLYWLDPVVKQAVSAQPYAALAWSGVSLLLPLLTSGTTQNEAMLEGFNLIGTKQLYWKICEDTYLKSPEQEIYKQLVEPLAQLYSDMISFQALAICHFSKAQISRAWEIIAGINDWGSRATKIKDQSSEVEKIIPNLEKGEIRKQWDEQLLRMQESQSTLNDIRQISSEYTRLDQERYKEKKERELLKELASNYESFKNFNEKRVKGTCEWFFKDDRFRRWRDFETSSLLWVSAGPGCGKSVLSRALVDENRLSINPASSTVCYFFFKDGDASRIRSTDALCAMLHQLFTQDHTGNLIKHALPRYNEGMTLRNNFPVLWKIFMDCAKSPEAGQIICVLDALDECEQESGEELIEELKTFYCREEDLAKSLKLMFLITSRPYTSLENEFHEFQTTTCLHFDGDEKSADIGDEINLVIDERVKKIASRFSAADRRELADQLKGMENRTYLWLHLVLSIIRGNVDYTRLSDIKELLSQIPPKVSGAYEKILNKSSNKDRTRKLLQLVLAAERPLTLDEVNVALVLADKPQESVAKLNGALWSKNELEMIIRNICGLFVSVYDSKLFFIHQTAREFLLSPEREGNWKGHFTLPESHSNMSRVCLNFLLLPDLPELSPETIYKKSTFCGYATGYWASHFTSQEDADAHKPLEDACMLCDRASRPEYRWLNPTRPYSFSNFSKLAVASHFNLRTVVLYLLDKQKSNIEPRDSSQTSALQAASARGHKEIVQLLLNKDADVNLAGGYYGSALQAASARGHKEIVQLLLDKDADVNLAGGRFGSALQAASFRGDKEIVQLLLDEGADVNLEGGFYGSALQAASAEGHKEIVQLLLDKDADVNLAGGFYGSALQAASAGGHKEIVQLLLDKDADVNLAGGRFGSALQAASFRGDKEIVQLLLDKGADVNLAGGYYGSALQAASAEGYKEIVQLLLDEGADVNLAGGRFGSALQAASARGDKEIVQLLLDKGADVNLAGGYFGSALQAASARGHREIEQLLLDRGAKRK